MSALPFLPADHAGGLPAARVAHAAGRALVALALWPARVLRARDTLAALGRLNDRELADIGLSRQDLRDSLALPLSADPTGPLGQARRRHCRR